MGGFRVIKHTFHCAENSESVKHRCHTSLSLSDCMVSLGSVVDEVRCSQNQKIVVDKEYMNMMSTEATTEDTRAHMR